MKTILYLGQIFHGSLVLSLEITNTMKKEIQKAQRYVILSGAKKNLGDFLIAERTSALLKHVRPDRELNEIAGWVNLAPHIDLINSSRAVIIPGGPGYRYQMYPGVYPFVANLNSIKVPIVPVALGWKGIPGDEHTAEHYSFSRQSHVLLKQIHEQNRATSCRDYITAEILLRNGYRNTTMTGCSVWYDLDKIGERMQCPAVVRTIAFTPPQRSEFIGQAIDLIDRLRQVFSEARMLCSFHRGIERDSYTNSGDARNALKICEFCRNRGIEIVDMAYGTQDLQHYEECDIHVGYRVHGHLYFLSQRKPSFLVNEDGRGRGMQEALALQSFDGYIRNHRLQEIPMARIGIARRFLQAYLPSCSVSPYTVSRVVGYIISELGNNFRRIKGACSVIDDTFPTMRDFLRSLP